MPGPLQWARRSPLGGALGRRLALAVAVGAMAVPAVPPLSAPASATIANQVVTWGYHNMGQLGDGTPPAKEFRNTPAPALLPAGTVVTAVGRVVGDIYAPNPDGNRNWGTSFAVTAEGSVFSWGENSWGELGSGSTELSSSTPVRVQLPPLTTVTAVAGGGGHVLALTGAGQVLSWGYNGLGQLGNGSTNDNRNPVPGLVLLPPSERFVAVAAGRHHSLAVAASGAVYAWGYNFSRQLGNGTRTDSSLPVKVSLPAGTTVTAVAAGAAHSLALTSDGRVLAWGANGAGQLGDGTDTPRSTPVATLLPEGTTVTAIAAGEAHSLALTSDGRVLAWGENGGKLGDGTKYPNYRLTPGYVLLPPGTRAASVAAGLAHSLAITTDGRLLTWGWDYYVLGTDPATSPWEPNFVVGAAGTPIAGVRAAAASLLHNLALTTLATTTTTLASSPNPSVRGAAVSLAATVAGTEAGTPSGSVAFFDGATRLGSAVVDATGVATFTTSALARGDHQITATYGGDATFGPSSSAPLTQSVTTPEVATVSPTAVAFADRAVGTTAAPSTITVSSSGQADLHVSSASLTGAQSGDFAITSDTCTGATLAPGSACAVGVSFTPAALGARSASLTFSDDAADSPQVVALSGRGVPTMTISDVTVTEGNTATTDASFAVELSAPSDQVVSVAYASADGTARAGSDFTAASGTLSFAPGETQKSLVVAVAGDTAYELKEKFKLNLTAASGAVIADGQGIGFIINDDPVPTLAIADLSRPEGTSTTKSTFKLTVSLSAPSGLPTTVAFATANGTAIAGSDYTARSGTLTIAAGATTATINVAVVADATPEANETFKVNLTNPTNATIARARAVATITNDD